MAAQAGDLSLIAGMGRLHWRRKCQPTPLFVPGKSHGQRSLVGTAHRVTKELDMTKATEHAQIKKVKVVVIIITTIS